jgi:RimJ/RimL family protein N-acetyltransferase
MKILETERLILRHVTKSDSEFMLDLLNQPSFIKYIGDRNVRNIEQAEEFIETRYQKSYDDNGYGLYLVELKEDYALTNVQASASNKSKIENQKLKMGVCGFVKRAELPNADIGFAFLPQFEGFGYAHESAEAVMNYGRNILGFTQINAITTQDNDRSGNLLQKLGFAFETLIEMPNNEVLKLYSTN